MNRKDRDRGGVEFRSWCHWHWCRCRSCTLEWYSLHTRAYKITQSGRHSSSGKQRSTATFRRKYVDFICRTTSQPASAAQPRALALRRYQLSLFPLPLC